MKTPEIYLTIGQLEDLLATAQAMQQVINRGHDWDLVSGFAQRFNDSSEGYFVGDVVYIQGKEQSPQVVLRIEYFNDQPSASLTASSASLTSLNNEDSL